MANREEELADSNGIIIRIETPAEKEYFCRGFYQIEEDCLYIPVFPSGKFYSFIDSPLTGIKTNSTKKPSTGISLDIDRKGRLLFITINTPRRFWKTDNSLEIPQSLETAEIRFLTFREHVNPPVIKYRTDKNILQIELNNRHVSKAYRVADSLVITASNNGELNSIWLNDIIDDRAAKKMAKWRNERLEESNEESSNNIEKFTRIEIE
ncbi:MAG: hypothetical protein KAR42_02365 [candidate division Zixibacteria bacterium]|nr:hypothetical protein [candidate division Zixibacteria bacterium]